MIGLFCLNQDDDWPVELLKVKRGIRDLGKCLTQENKEDGCHGNVLSKSKLGGGGVSDEYQRDTMEVLEQVT